MCGAGSTCLELKSQPVAEALHLPEAAATVCVYVCASACAGQRRKESYLGPAALDTLTNQPLS